ncbi:hypothetical protein PAXRUDRAFT_390730 [Paxillus rubicundulus Ve08.2h10]|uniref:ER membrane protein complex subunit 6 n=1 Tax=Paxillus rubicundulus Ve08.2h10 TaxID=930991 RepID=A0A0D0DDH1_9AGAM|nr:hypothetical protein PAXRUDRAFT_390730 [Paxillus rubicundulus Ve08.2h10]
MLSGKTLKINLSLPACVNHNHCVEQPNCQMATSSDPAAQLVFAPNVLHNQSLTSVKFLSSCFAGAVAGILGLENWLGFALFAASVLSTSFVIYVINCKGNPSKYLPGGPGELVNPGQDNIFTFILVWTLFYGIVHVYD